MSDEQARRSIGIAAALGDERECQTQGSKLENGATRSVVTSLSCQRWMMDISRWSPSDAEWTFLLALIPEAEATEVKRFRQPADQKRALVSRLMQRRSASLALGIPYTDVVIKRTKGRKPFVANKGNKRDMPNFNFNVSHEGDFVVLASEPLCICGIDVAAPKQLQRKGQEQGMDEIYKIFGSSFTSSEWNAILGQDGEGDQRSVFQRHWSLKEAFVKARGDGIAFELARCEFSFSGSNSLRADIAKLAVDGVHMENWAFHLSRLPSNHWVSVARGPPSDIVDEFGDFKSSLQRLDVAKDDQEIFQRSLHAKAPDFVNVSIKDLIPLSCLDEYPSATGAEK